MASQTKPQCGRSESQERYLHFTKELQSQLGKVTEENEKKLDEMQSKITKELRSQLGKVTEENDKKLDEMQSKITKELRSQLGKVTEENEKKLDEMQSKSTKELWSQLGKVTEENEKKLDEMQSKITKELWCQLGKVTEENEKKLDEMQSKSTKELWSQFRKVTEENEKKLNEKQSEINHLQIKLEDSNKTREEYEKKLNLKKDENNRLQNQVEELCKKNHPFIWIAIIVLAVLIGLSLFLKEHEENRHELRLMLVGKTGAGKSASGNTILGENSLRVEPSPASVTDNCEKRNKFIAGRNITIIDTPGVMDTWLNSEQTAHNAPQCISSFRPAPHVFLLVIRLGRFTQEEINAVKWIQENFGEQALKFTLILFTGGDLLEGKPVEKFISNSYELQSLVDTCRGRYHVFNNYDQSNRTQVTQLFEKINQMLHENMGYIYSVELYQYVKQEEERKREILEREITECKSLVSEITGKEAIKRKELEEEFKKGLKKEDEENGKETKR